MKPEAILWDLDGTLVDGAAAIHDSFEHAVATRGHAPVPRHLVAGRIGLPLRLMFRELCQVDDRESAELVRAYRERFEVVAPKLVRATPGMREAIDAFEGKPMGIVTTKAVEPARTVLKALSIEDRFAAVVGVDTVRRPKPDPEAVRVALARLGVGSLHAAFIGDTIMDVLAGKAAGAKTVAMLTGHGDRDELHAAQPDATIEDLRELVAAIGRL